MQNAKSINSSSAPKKSDLFCRIPMLQSSFQWCRKHMNTETVTMSIFPFDWPVRLVEDMTEEMSHTIKRSRLILTHDPKERDRRSRHIRKCNDIINSTDSASVEFQNGFPFI